MDKEYQPKSRWNLLMKSNILYFHPQAKHKKCRLISTSLPVRCSLASQKGFWSNSLSRNSLVFNVLFYFIFQKAWEPVHSSEGFALIGPQRHSRATQSRSLAAAGRLPRQPWPAWTIPHPHHQGNAQTHRPGETATFRNLVL